MLRQRQAAHCSRFVSVVVTKLQNSTSSRLFSAKTSSCFVDEDDAIESAVTRMQRNKEEMFSG
jgi:hypothetical protein